MLRLTLKSIFDMKTKEMKICTLNLLVVLMTSYGCSIKNPYNSNDMDTNASYQVGITNNNNNYSTYGDDIASTNDDMSNSFDPRLHTNNNGLGFQVNPQSPMINMPLPLHEQYNPVQTNSTNIINYSSVNMQYNLQPTQGNIQQTDSPQRGGPISDKAPLLHNLRGMHNNFRAMVYKQLMGCKRLYQHYIHLLTEEHKKNILEYESLLNLTDSKFNEMASEILNKPVLYQQAPRGMGGDNRGINGDNRPRSTIKWPLNEILDNSNSNGPNFISNGPNFSGNAQNFNSNGSNFVSNGSKRRKLNGNK